MKNITEILAESGVTIPEDKQEGFNKLFGENYKTVAELDKVRTARDSFQTQLNDARAELKNFEGVDVAELQGKVKTLSESLDKKEREYKQSLDDRDFDDLLNKVIAESKALNPKAVRGLLDEETLKVLKASKNRTEDIKKAVDAIKADNGYMFKSDEPIDNPNPTGRTKHEGNEPTAEDFRKMSYNQRLKLKREDPELYKKLKG